VNRAAIVTRIWFVSQLLIGVAGTWACPKKDLSQTSRRLGNRVSRRRPRPSTGTVAKAQSWITAVTAIRWNMSKTPRKS